jgi:hypothetical protein
VRSFPVTVVQCAHVRAQDLAKDSVRVVRRDTGAATDLPLADLGAQVYALMETMHRDMFAKAKAAYDSRLKTIRDWADFVPWLNEKGVCVIPWCETEACEDDIKARSAKECAAPRTRAAWVLTDGDTGPRSCSSLRRKTSERRARAPRVCAFRSIRSAGVRWARVPSARAAVRRRSSGPCASSCLRLGSSLTWFRFGRSY